MAKTYYVRSGYCAENVTKHLTLADAMVEWNARRTEVHGGYYVYPFITSSDADLDNSDGLTADEREAVDLGAFREEYSSWNTNWP